MNPADVPGRHKKRGRHFEPSDQRPPTPELLCRAASHSTPVELSLHQQESNKELSLLKANSQATHLLMSSPCPSVQNTMVDPGPKLGLRKNS